MIILAIDTSCDDTCCSILEVQDSQFKIRSNIVSSQVKIHQKYGGVYPTLAKREHQRNLALVLKESLLRARLLKSKVKSQVFRGPHSAGSRMGQESKIQLKTQKLKEILKREEILYKKLKRFLVKYQKPRIDIIAVTIGPGLEPCLWQGVNFARALAFWWNLPVVPVNHIEAHIFANWLAPISEKSKVKSQKSKIQIKNQKIEFPAVCLVVSGGHTQLILTRRIGNYKIIGETRDDAAGECFDKTARILGLPYPGGPSVAKMATKIKIQKSKIKDIKLPRPMINSKNYDFSFSGLKTAVLYDFKKRPKEVRSSKEYVREMAREIQQAIIDVLIKKTIKAARDYRVKSILLGGGVAANDELRKQFQSKIKNLKLKINFLVPPKNLCTDNATMVGVAGYFNRKKATKNYQKIKALPDLRIT